MFTRNSLSIHNTSYCQVNIPVNTVLANKEKNNRTWRIDFLLWPRRLRDALPLRRRVFQGCQGKH